MAGRTIYDPCAASRARTHEGCWRTPFYGALALLLLALVGTMGPAQAQQPFFTGAGDARYLQALNVARRMWAADVEYQSVPMLCVNAHAFVRCQAANQPASLPTLCLPSLPA